MKLFKFSTVIGLQPYLKNYFPDIFKDGASVFYNNFYEFLEVAVFKCYSFKYCFYK